MEPWKTSSNWAPTQSGPVGSGLSSSSFRPRGAVTSSFWPSNPALPAAPFVPAQTQADAASFSPSTAAQSSPVDSSSSSFPPSGAVISSFSPSNPAPAAAAPTIPAPAQAAAPAAVVSPAPAPATNGSRGLHRCPHCHKMGIHRPEECRSAPQNISMAGVTVVEFGPGTTVATLRAVMSHMSQQYAPAGPSNGIKKSRRRRGHKPGKKTNDTGARPEDKDPGAGSTGGGGGMVPV